MSTTNKKTKSTLARLGLLAMAAVVVGGCGTLSPTKTLQTESRIKAKDGIVFGDANPYNYKVSVSTVCERFAAAKDPRCDEHEKYNAYRLVVSAPNINPVIDGDVVNVLVPKSAGEVMSGDIVKVRLDGFRPAYFVMIAAHKGDKGCFYGTRGAWSGVTCPKHNWDFMRDMNL